MPLFENFLFTPLHTSNCLVLYIKNAAGNIPSLMLKELVIQVSQNHSCTILSKIICRLVACHWNLNPKNRHTTLAAPKALHTVKQIACVQTSPISLVATKEIGDVCKQAIKQSSLVYQDRQLSKGKRLQGGEKRWWWRELFQSENFFT